MDGVTLTKLKQVPNPKGDIFHAIKVSDDGFYKFGEAYFSTINKGDIKGWKKHTKMTLNLVVIMGEIEIVVYDNNNFFSVILSRDNYQRLTVSPNLWMAFKGLASVDNIMLNIASIEHNPDESESIDLGFFNYKWQEL